MPFGKMYRNELYFLTFTIVDWIDWQNGSFPKILFTDNFITQKVSYIHQNPVKAGFVSKPEDWRYSSASPDSPIKVSELWLQNGKRLI